MLLIQPIYYLIACIAFSLCAPKSAFASSPWVKNSNFFIGTDQIWHISGATEAAVTHYIGDGGTGFADAILDEFLNAQGAGIRDEIKTNTSVQLGYSLTQHTAMQRFFPAAPPDWRINRQFSMAYGLSDFTIPNGAGVLVEPIQLSFQNVNLSASIAAELPLTTESKGLFDNSSLVIATGLQANISRSKIRSPVIKIDHQHRQTLPFVSVRLQRKIGESRRNALFIEATKARRRDTTVKAGLTMGF